MNGLDGMASSDLPSYIERPKRDVTGRFRAIGCGQVSLGRLEVLVEHAPNGGAFVCSLKMWKEKTMFSGQGSVIRCMGKALRLAMDNLGDRFLRKEHFE